MSRTSTLSRTLAIALTLGTMALNAAPAAAGSDGIKSLIAVTQMQSQNANDAALEQSAASQSQTGPLILEATAEPQAYTNADSPRGQAEKRLSDHRNEMRRNWAP